MAYNIPTTQELTDDNISRFEARLGQTVPINDQAFVRVLSVVEALIGTTLYKYAAERALQNLILTATGEDLVRNGTEYGVVKKPAIAAIIEISQPANDGTSIPASTEYVGDSNGVRYIVNSTVVASGGAAILEITAKETGVIGNLTTGDTLTIDKQIAGITSTTATYNIMLTDGADEESEESYRRRSLLEVRTVGGGGNPVDYRRWAEENINVYRAFPYSGAPIINDTKKLRDGDMELPSTDYWLPGNNATITKETSSPHSGVRNLRVAYNGTSNPYAYQLSLTIGKNYRLTGYYKSDGTYAPQIYDSGGQLIVDGITTGSGYIYFDQTFIATGTQLRFQVAAIAAGYADFDKTNLYVLESWSGDRTVYIEATTDVDPDGIPTQQVLDLAREYININQDTLKTRTPMGVIDGDLYVEPVYITRIYIIIEGLNVSADIETQVKADIEQAIEEYLYEITPYIEGLDFEGDRNDIITNLTLSNVVQDILKAYGGSAKTINFSDVSGVPVPLEIYQLSQGELARYGSVSYA